MFVITQLRLISKNRTRADRLPRPKSRMFSQFIAKLRFDNKTAIRYLNPSRLYDNENCSWVPTPLHIGIQPVIEHNLKFFLTSISKWIIMSESLRNVYAAKALSQIPRLLGNQDRNPFSPTYGCFHRDYWLDKTSDFPDAVRQFGVQSLALVFKHDFPNNTYKGNKKILEWTIAGMQFWVSIQHKDGSFDEFYPFERGWVGPTAFTTFTIIEALNLLQEEIPEDTKASVTDAVRKAAYFIAAGESEEDHLANHHAMACLAVWKAASLLQDNTLKQQYLKLFKGFLSYQNAEGWSREYDGVDPGYLSATVSFFAKIYQIEPDPEILKIAKSSIEFCSFFVYPNGFYAGSLGSRNTLHFYAHGFEVFAKEIPLAKAIAEKMLVGLSENKLVAPEIISDRYVFYRVPEYLQAYLDYSQPGENLPQLPYAGSDYQKFSHEAGVWSLKKGKIYCVANLAKGGVVKIFNTEINELIYNDCGVIGKLSNDLVVTTQWIDPKYKFQHTENTWEVSGCMNIVPSNKLFTPLKNVIFRSILILIGWHPTLAHLLKGKIRKILMLGNRRMNINFKRIFTLHRDKISIKTSIENLTDKKFKKIMFGDEFFVRYVPQSRYFQSQELQITGEILNPDEIKQFNSEGKVTKEIEIKI